MFKATIVFGLLAFVRAGVPLGYGAPSLGFATHGVALAAPVAVAAGPVIGEKTTVLANSAPGTGGHAPNNLVTLLRSGDGGYVPGEEPDPPVIQRPSSTVYRSHDTIGHGIVGVGPHGEAVHAARPFQYGYVNRNEHGGSYQHHEKADAGNRRTGSYGFTGADGTYRQVDYVADEHGYRAKVSTNEQGTASHAAADALTVAEKPPYLQYSPPAAPVVKQVAAPVYAAHAAPVYAAHAAPVYAAHAAPVYAAHAAPVYAHAAAPVYRASLGYPAPGLSAGAIAASRGLPVPRPLTIGGTTLGLARGGLVGGGYGLAHGGLVGAGYGLAHGGLVGAGYGLARGGLGYGLARGGLGYGLAQGGLIHG